MFIAPWYLLVQDNVCEQTSLLRHKCSAGILLGDRGKCNILVRSLKNINESMYAQSEPDHTVLNPAGMKNSGFGGT